MPHRTQYGARAVGLEVGAAPGWVGLVRSAAAHVGAAAALSVADVDDLRLAADESFAAITSGAEPDEAVRVHFTWGLGVVHMSMTRPGRSGAVGGQRDDLTFILLRSLVQDAVVSEDAGGLSLTWVYRPGVLA